MIKDFRGKSPIIPDSCYVSESVDLIGDVTLGENVSLWFGTVVRGDMHFITVGNRSNIQDNSVIHVTTKVSPTRIGDEVTVGHNAIIHGATIEDRCLIGMGAIIMNGAIIGRGSVIGAGAVIKENMVVPELSLVVGIPGKIIKTMTEETYKNNIKWAHKYVQLSKIHKENP